MYVWQQQVVVVEHEELLVLHGLISCQDTPDLLFNHLFSDEGVCRAVGCLVQIALDRKLRDQLDAHWVHPCDGLSREFLVSEPSKLVPVMNLGRLELEDPAYPLEERGPFELEEVEQLRLKQVDDEPELPSFGLHRLVPEVVVVQLVNGRQGGEALALVLGRL